MRNQQHIKLPNDATLVLEFDDDALIIAEGNEDEGIEGYICQIDPNGVLTYCNSGESPGALTRGLRRTPQIDPSTHTRRLIEWAHRALHDAREADWRELADLVADAKTSLTKEPTQ